MKLSRKINIDNQQRNLLNLLKSGEFYEMTLEKVAEKIWASYSQWVINKLKQLESKWLIRFSWIYWKYERKKYEVMDSPVSDVVYLPLLGFAQCWNLWSEVTIDEITSEKLAFPTKELPIKSINDISRYIFVRAKGKSMEPKIYEWDLLLIRLQQDYSEWEMVCIIHENRPKIKILKSIGSLKFLMSINKDDTADQEIIPTNEIRMIWVVKKIISTL